jgi:hypothetical protein
MKKVSLMMTVLVMSISAFAAPKAVKVNTAASSVAWYAEKVTGKHNGTLKLANGSLESNGKMVTGGNGAVTSNINHIKVGYCSSSDYLIGKFASKS